MSPKWVASNCLHFRLYFPYIWMMSLALKFDVLPQTYVDTHLTHIAFQKFTKLMMLRTIKIC